MIPQYFMQFPRQQAHTNSVFNVFYNFVVHWLIFQISSTTS